MIDIYIYTFNLLLCGKLKVEQENKELFNLIPVNVAPVET